MGLSAWVQRLDDQSYFSRIILYNMLYMKSMSKFEEAEYLVLDMQQALSGDILSLVLVDFGSSYRV